QGLLPGPDRTQHQQPVPAGRAHFHNGQPGSGLRGRIGRAELMAIGYTLEGFNLHQPDIGFRLLEGTEFASTIAPRRVNISVRNMHGEVPMWNDPLDTTTL